MRRCQRYKGKMPEQQARARLRVHGHGDIEVELVAAYLTDLKHAYDSVLQFDVTIEQMYVLRYPYSWPPQRFRNWPPTAEEIASLVLPSEEIILSAVSLTSPGFWEFLGTLNPLEVLRKYLNDRHERHKDRDYRESAERRRLELENLSLENKVISERIQLLKANGATDQDLSPLVNRLIYKPLVALDRYQDKGVIEHAEILPIERKVAV